MNKKHHDTIWNQLTPEQTGTLRVWLLERNLTYTTVKARLLGEWNITASISSICRHYQSLMREKLQEDFLKVKMTLKSTEKADVDLAGLLSGVLTIMSKTIVPGALQEGGSKEMARLAGLLLQQRQQEIQDGWLKLAREKFQFNSAEAALKLLPMAEQIRQEDIERERAKMRGIMVRLFGKRAICAIQENPSEDPENDLVPPAMLAQWRQELAEEDEWERANAKAQREKQTAAESQKGVEKPKPAAQMPEGNVRRSNVAEPSGNLQSPETAEKPAENFTNATH